MAKNYELGWARTNAGLTQAEAAEKMGVNRITFSRWEVGTVDIPPARWAKFLKIVELSAKDIPAEDMAVVPAYIDGERSTPYLPMCLQRTPQAYWPPTEAKQWAKSMNDDVDDLKGAWLGRYGDEDDHHDYLLEQRAVNVLWAHNQLLEFKPDGSYSVTPKGRAHEAEAFALDAEELRLERLARTLEKVNVEDLI